MRQNQNQNQNNARRSRGRGNRKPGNTRNQIFDSNGPGARVRGNSAQIYEKYQQLARDASSSGDRVAAEGFYQHAEHYYRLMDAAGLNRDGTQQDHSQQQNDDTAQNGQTVQNNEAVVATDAVSQPAVQPAPQPAPQHASQHAPENVAALIEAVEQGNTNPPDQAVNDAAKGDEDVKPARRPRSRRANGSANGQAKPSKAADAETTQDDSDAQSDDSEPVSA